jgi:hypothetical protein
MRRAGQSHPRCPGAHGHCRPVAAAQRDAHGYRDGDPHPHGDDHRLAVAHGNRDGDADGNADGYPITDT